MICNTSKPEGSNKAILYIFNKFYLYPPSTSEILTINSKLFKLFNKFKHYA